jgi:hypothetical protein
VVDVGVTAGEGTEEMATAGSGAARATPDAQAHATKAAIDETATAGGNGARAKATAETQAKAAKAVVDVKATAGRDERAEAKPGARAGATKAESQDMGNDTDKRKKVYKMDDRRKGSS